MNNQICRLVIYLFSVLLFSSIQITAIAGDHQVLTTEKLETWLKGYEEAWETLDADKAAQLFTNDATYQETPYKDPFIGREGIHNYWKTVTADQQNVDFTFKIISVSGNTGVAHWHSEFLQPSTGSTIILDGIFILEFSKEGLCKELKEWWHFQAIPVKENSK